MASHRNRYLIGVLALAFLVWGVPLATASQGFSADGLAVLEPGLVTEVTDGDTVVLADGRIVRMVGIQAPKLPLGRRGFRKWPLADASKEALEALSMGQSVALYSGGRQMDRWSRVLAHLRADDHIWLQGEMLRAGMARVYSFADNTALVDEMLAIERDARSARRGIWALSYYAVRSANGATGYANSFQLVEGIIVDVAHVRGRVYLNFGEDWHTDFTILVPSRVRRAFERDGRDLKALEGKAVRVRGWLKDYNGPLIELTHPQQLEVLGLPIGSVEEAEGQKKDPLKSGPLEGDVQMGGAGLP
jgi:micrococcal nuclease